MGDRQKAEESAMHPGSLHLSLMCIIRSVERFTIIGSSDMIVSMPRADASVNKYHELSMRVNFQILV